MGADSARSAKSPGRGLRRLAVLLVLLLVLHVSAALAVDVTGSYSIFRSETDRNDLTTESTQQQATFDVYQGFTPFLSVRLGYQYFNVNTAIFDGTELDRTSRQPRLELVYNRSNLTARLSAQRNEIEGSSAQDSFETRSLLANVSWTPTRGPGYELTFQQTTNLADISVFGRDTDARVFSFETFYDRSWWGASYAFRRNSLDQRVGNFGFEQNRHELRGYVSRSLVEDRVSMDLSTTLTRLDRSSIVSSDAGLADPVPAVDGLFLVDTSPEIGELGSAPALIDGDTTTPAAPGIDIGGANFDRNIGLDLGIVAQVSRLEINVDAVSQRELIWAVYHSPDNLNWQTVPGVVSIFDVALLRYELSFPETTNRYFKAVNTSVNSEPTVRVTEIRALVDVAADPAQGGGFESSLLRADLGFNLRPSERISGRVELGFSNDEDVAAGFTRREFRQSHAGARFAFELAEDLRLNLGYRYNDLEVRRDPVLLRSEEAYDASLTWTPLRAINAVLSIQRRDESDQDRLLQSTETVRGLFTVVFLPDLRLITDVDHVRAEDPFSGFEREGWSWRETLVARPTPRWTLRGSYGRIDFDTRFMSGGQGATVLRERSDYSVSTTWAPTPLLVFSGSWSLSRENERANVRQSYSLAYNPAPKLNLTAVHQEFESESGEIGQGFGNIVRPPRETTNDSATLNYRLNNHIMTFGSLSRSTASNLGIETSRVTSVRFGLRLYI